MDGSKSIKTSTIAIDLWNNSNFGMNMTMFDLVNACVGYDGRRPLPTSACRRSMMWVKLGRTQWVLIEEMAEDRLESVVKPLILVLLLRKKENVPDLIDSNQYHAMKEVQVQLDKMLQG